MTRPAKLAIAILVAAALSSCGREGDADRTVRPDVVPDRHVARHRDDSGQSRRPESAGADERRHDVDVRGRAADEPAVVPRHDPLDASVADDGDDGIDGAVSGQHSAHADQHARRVQLAARLSRDVRERRDRGGDADRGRLHRHGLSAGDVHRPGRADEGLASLGLPNGCRRRHIGGSACPLRERWLFESSLGSQLVNSIE